MTKRQIVTLSTLSVVVLMLLLCLNFIKINTYRVDAYYAQIDDSIDVVVVGPSTTQRGFVPAVAWEEYGYTSFNWSQTLTHVEVIKMKLNELNKDQHPKLVFVDIYPLSYRTYEDYTERIQNFIDRMPNTDDKYAYAEKYDDVYTPNDQTYSIMQLHNYWRNVANFENDTKYNGFVAQYNGKYIGSSKNLKSKKDINSEDVTPLSEYNQNNLAEIIEVCKEHKNTYNTQFLFGIMPRLYVEDKSYAYGSILEDVATIEKYIAPVLEENGFDFVNFCDEIKINMKADMHDIEHLNNHGAVKFTRYFSQYIKDKYGIGDIQHSDKVVNYYNQLSQHTKSKIKYD